MARLLGLRVLSVLALCSLALFFVSLDPFLSAAPARPGVSDRTPPVSVNRFRKGDRLPLMPSGAIRPERQGSDGLQGGDKVPVGCDRAFSPVTSPSLSTVYGRCMT